MHWKHSCEFDVLFYLLKDRLDFLRRLISRCGAFFFFVYDLIMAAMDRLGGNSIFRTLI